MSEQGSLFDTSQRRRVHPGTYARTRKTDPGSSFEAAREITESGEAERQVDVVTRIVHLTPGLTARELVKRHAEYLAERGLDYHAVMRRVSECPRVRAAQPRKCRESGRTAQTWEPVS